jgi:type II secretory pathway pseudopilin PulG
MIVVAIIGLLATIAIPNFVRARTQGQLQVCIENLHCIDVAKQQWALETGRAATATPSAAQIQPYLGRGSGGSLPTCPLDTGNSFVTSYAVNSVSSAPVCNINTNHVAN